MRNDYDLLHEAEAILSGISNPMHRQKNRLTEWATDITVSDDYLDRAEDLRKRIADRINVPSN